MDIQTKLVNVLATGTTDGQYLDPIPESTLTTTISFLKNAAQYHSELYLELLIATCSLQITPMTSIAVGVLLSLAPNDFLTKSGQEVYEIIKLYDAQQLYELVKLIKAKTFGRGLGSRNQKLIRRVMESWTADDLKALMVGQGKFVYNLVRVIHPRFTGNKAEILNVLLKRPNSTITIH
jgi:hypothetical protein